MSNNNLRDRLRARRKELNSQTSDGGGLSRSNATELEVLSSTSISPINDGNDSERLQQALSQQRAAHIRRFEETDLRDSVLREPELTQSNTFSSQSSVPFPSAGFDDDDDENSFTASPVPTSTVKGSSLRSRMRAKMEASRTATPTPESSAKLQRIRDRVALSSKFAETLKRATSLEETHLNSQVEERIKRKSVQFKSTGTTEQDRYDFFTKEFQPEEEKPEEGDNTASPTEQPSDEQSADAVQEPVEQPEITHDNEALITHSYTEVIHDEWKMYEMKQVSYRGYREQLELENVQLFIPNSTDVSMERKLGINKKPRYLELEGFYVGKKPYASRINTNILENRLLAGKDDGVEWFGLDGRVDTLPDPTRMDATRPWHLESVRYDRSMEVVYIKAFKQRREDKYLSGENNNEIQIDLSTIVFHHHPLMSKEHVLASNIQLLYNEYVDRRHKNYITFFTEKLQALRDAVDVLLQASAPAVSLLSTGRLSDTEEAIPSMEDRVYDYMSEIRLTTRQLNIAEMEERELMRKIIEVWNRIKKIREEQGYTNTGVKLTIQTEEVDYDLDYYRWQREGKLEVKERKMEFEATVWNPYREKVRKYKQQLKEWKKKRKETERQRASRDDGEDADVIQSDVSRQEEEGDRTEVSDANDLMDIDRSNSDRPVRPIAPPKFSKELVTKAVTESLLKHRRNPGEARMWLLLAHTAQISDSSKLSDDEEVRRRAVQKAQVFVKVFFNNHVVFTTEPTKLTSDFRVNFGSIFRIVINQWPENFRVEIYDAGMMLNTLIAKTTLRIPEVCVNSNNVRLQEVEFVGEGEVSYDHAGVGSKVRIELGDDHTPALLPTRGHLISSVSWGVDENGEVLAPRDLAQSFLGSEVIGDAIQMYNKANSDKLHDAMGVGVVQDPEALSKWLQEHRIDPNHPDNATVVPYMVGKNKAGGGVVSYGADYFRLEQLQQSFNFAEDDFVERNRLRLLRLRFQEELEFRTLTMIPSSDYEILDAAFAAYEHRIRNKDSLDKINIDRGRKGQSGLINEHRINVLQFRQRVRDAVLFRFHISRHYFTFEDMIHEDSVPNVKLLGDTFKKLLQRRRPLRPKRRERKKATTMMLGDGQVNLLVNVVRAYNVPTRDAPFSNSTTQMVTQQTHEMSRSNPFQSTAYPPTPIQNETGVGTKAPRMFEVSPFVSVTFQENSASTESSNGPQPNWNEELRLPFTAPNGDYSPNALQTCNDNLYINLFDKFKELIPAHDIGEDSSVEAYRIINHWLGSFVIPFSTIFHQGKIEGTYRLRAPPVLLGYRTDFAAANPNEYDQTGGFETQVIARGTYLTVFITIDPVLRPMEAPKLRFDSQETDELLAHAEKFVLACKTKKGVDRPLKTTVIDIKGEPVFITRFISPLAPPSELVDSNSQTSLATAERLARYVSLIPTESDNVTYAGVCDLWCTCDQFLNMLCGDEEEHAVLLLNYFLHLNKEAYLVLCEGVPEGETSYVLTVEAATEEYLLWNACTGEWYSHKDTLCPVTSVGALVNSENIWFNIQKWSKPCQVRYWVENQKDWKPLFTTKWPNPGLSTNQPASLVYVSPDMTYVSRLSERIERVLKERFTSWRPRHITKWNRTGNSALYKILKDLEPNYNRRNMNSTGDGNHAVIIREVLGDVSFTGFPITMPFTDIDAIVAAVRATDLHKVQVQSIEFSLAVHIHPYPGGVLAVWVYIASIINRRRYTY